MRIPGWDRAGLERLLHYCVRPPFALDRLEAIDDAHLRYHLSKPQPDGANLVGPPSLAPSSLVPDKSFAELRRSTGPSVSTHPPPRVYRHRYHGVLAPNSPLRAQVTAAHPPWGDASVGLELDFDTLAQPEPEMEFDQRITW